MAANGISTLSTKEAKQKAKLDLAAQNRAAGGDTSSPAYRARNVYDITQLPTQYSGNSVVDNPNPGGLVPGRPWVLGPYTLNFASATYSGPSGTISDPFTASLLTHTRTTPVLAPDSSGKFQTYAANTVAINDLGLHLRGNTRTNLIQNNSMVGGVAGTPGTLPNNWSIQGTLPSGITRTIVAVGSSDPVKGLPYIDFQFSGTAASGGTLYIQPHGNTECTCTNTSYLGASAWLALTAGSLPIDGTTGIRWIVSYANGTGTTQGSGQSSDDRLFNRDTTLRQIKVIGDYTQLTAGQQAVIACGKAQVEITWKSGVAYNFTIRVAAPQLEIVSAATDDVSNPILTTNATVTHNADVVTFSNDLLTSLQGNSGSIEIATASMNKSGIDFRSNASIVDINSVKGLYRTSDGRIASELGSAPQTYKSWRSQFGWARKHLLSWNNVSGITVASDSSMDSVTVSDTMPAITSIALTVDGCISNLTAHRAALSDLSNYTAKTSDVIVYGATSGGVIAAAAAKRAGSTASICGGWREVNPGGMSTGGLSAIDASVITAFGGLSIDVVKYANELLKKSSLTSTTIASRYFLRAFDYLIRTYQIDMHWSKGVTTATKSGTRITSFATTKGQTFNGSTFIDASYEGDLMAAANVTYVYGREAKDTTLDSLGIQKNPANGNLGHQPSTSASFGMDQHQFTATTGAGNTAILTVDPYVTVNTPASGLLNGVVADTTTTNGAADNEIQAYNFRLTVTTTSSLGTGAPLATNGTPPTYYNAADYELLGRYLSALATAGYTCVAFSATPTTNQFNLGLFIIPNQNGTYYDFNANNGFSTDSFGANWGSKFQSITGGTSANYAVASYAEREAFWKWQESFNRGMFYWLAYSGDSRIPAQLASDAASLTLCNDHYLDPHENDSAHWMYQLYIREARRMVGLEILDHSDVVGTDGATPVKGTNVVATGSYAIDSHHVRRMALQIGGVWKTINEGNLLISSTGNKMFPIVAEYLMPQKVDCSNLMVTFAASARHTGFGALRMELAHMASSESAGIIMAQVSSQVTQPDIQDYLTAHYSDTIRPALLAANQVVTQTN